MGGWAKAMTRCGQAGFNAQTGVQPAGGAGYSLLMRDRFFYPLAIGLTVGMILLALVWPQGQGQRSPAPFGHEPTTPAKSAGLRTAQ